MKNATQIAKTPASTGLRMTRTYTDPSAAEDFCRRMNRYAKSRDLIVMVDGPNVDEVTVMPIRDAIANDFLYRWVA